MFIIKDWAGNHLFIGEEFETFEDAWAYIYENIKNEDDFDNFYVEEK